MAFIANGRGGKGHEDRAERGELRTGLGKEVT